MQRLLAAVTVSGLLCACNIGPAPQSKPGSFERVHVGRYEPSKQLEFMDCVFDSFASDQSTIRYLQVRQTHRADGYRLDLINGPYQYLVADFKTDGAYELRRATFPAMLSMMKEEDACKSMPSEIFNPLIRYFFAAGFDGALGPHWRGCAD